MTAREFRDAVDAHPLLRWVGVLPDSMEVAIACDGARPGMARAIPLRDVVTREWEELEAVLTGQRPGRILQHMSRIIGYFSQHRYWNRSKLAELADRRRGIYGVPARVDIPREELPDEVLAAHVAAGAELACELSKRGEQENADQGG